MVIAADKHSDVAIVGNQFVNNGAAGAAVRARGADH
jgi:hypothetical protein